LRITAVVAVLLILALILLPAVMYRVDQREMAVVLQFGRPVTES